MSGRATCAACGVSSLSTEPAVGAAVGRSYCRDLRDELLLAVGHRRVEELPPQEVDLDLEVVRELRQEGLQQQVRPRCRERHVAQVRAEGAAALAARFAARATALAAALAAALAGGAILRLPARVRFARAQPVGTRDTSRGRASHEQAARTIEADALASLQGGRSRLRVQPAAQTSRALHAVAAHAVRTERLHAECDQREQCPQLEL